MRSLAAKVETIDVLVVGAGPVGLMLAAELRLWGVRVVVLERLTSPMTESRASTLHARTMEILDSRGLLSSFAAPPNELMGHFAGVPLDLSLPSKYPGQWKVAQSNLEQVLQERALAAGAEIRRGDELVGLELGPDTVEAVVASPRGRSRVRARYLVACDGERSDVRRLMDVPFPRTPGAPPPGEERVLYRADLTGVHLPERRFGQLEGGLAVAACLPNGVTRVMVHDATAGVSAGGDDEVSFAQVVDAWKRVTGEDIASGRPVWLNRFTDASRQLANYREGRVFWAGDAAHLQLPVGGQAINLGIQDAVNLGWKLALCVQDLASDGLLDTYHNERHPVGASVLENVRAQATLLLGGPRMAPVRRLMADLLEREEVRLNLARRISGLDIRYDMGPGQHPLLGCRMPHLEVELSSGLVSIASLMTLGRGLILITSRDAEIRAELAQRVRPWRDRVTPVFGDLPSEVGDDLLVCEALLIRPDGHVAWVAVDGGDVGDAMQRWFGPPQDSRHQHLEQKAEACDSF